MVNKNDKSELSHTKRNAGSYHILHIMNRAEKGKGLSFLFLSTINKTGMFGLTPHLAS